MKKSMVPKPITTILLSVLGAALGTIVMLYHVATTSESRSFIMTPGFYVWLFFMIVSAIAFTLSAPVVLKHVLELKAYFKGNGLEIFSTSIIMCFLFVVPFIPRGPSSASVLPSQIIRIFILAGLGWIVALLAMIGIWLVHAALRVEFKEVRVDHKQILRFQNLKKQLQIFLYVLGILISLMTLSLGAQRNALISADAIKENEIPIENILTMGAYFTVMVALSYISTYWLHQEVGRQICEVYFPTSSITPESMANWCSDRKNLETLLNVAEGAGQNIKSGIVILAPLLSGIVSVLLRIKA